MKHILTTVILIILLFLCSRVWATNYYVCDDGTDCNAGAGSGWSTGSDSNNGLAKGTAWKTIDKALNSGSPVSPGDTIIVGDGTYTDHDANESVTRVRISGSAEDGYITLKAENLYGAIVDGENDTQYGFYLIDAKWIWIEGFDIKRLENKGIFANTSGGAASGKCEHIYVYKNKIHHIGNAEQCVTGQGKGAITSRQQNEYITFDSNIIYEIWCIPPSETGVEDYENLAVYAIGKHWLIKNNIFYGLINGWPMKLCGHDGLLAAGTPTHIIVNNTFASTSNGIAECIDGSGDGDAGYSGGYGHIVWRGCDHGDYVPHDVILHNNIFYNPPIGQCPGSADWNAAIRIPSWYDQTYLDSASIKNNVTSAANLYQCRDSGAKVTCTGSPTLADNTTSLALASFNFTDEPNDDYSLLVTATDLIDQGTSSYAPDYDFAGLIRPNNTLFDIGAYEYDAGSAPPAGGSDTTWVAANDDDGYKKETDGTWASFSGTYYLALGYDGQHRSGHFRFQLNIPQGATITSAVLTLTAERSRVDGTLFDVYAEDVDNSVQINNVGEYNTAVGQLTTANVNWDLPATVGDTEYDSPDIKTVIQEIVDRVGWLPNQYVQLFCISSASTSYSYLYPFEEGVGPAKLVVEYEYISRRKVIIVS